MSRLLIVLAVLVVALALVWSRQRSAEETAAPEQVYLEQTRKARELEQQMQQQVDRQLEQIDAAPAQQ